MGSAFTTFSDGIARRLTNEAVIKYHDREMKVTALWDTGATGSCISMEVVKQLQLESIGEREVHTASGKDIQNTFLVDVDLPNSVTVKDLVVSDSAIGAQGIGMLIGMDIITLGDFAVSTYNQKTVFTFRIPSEKKTDYVQEIRLAQVMGPKHGHGLRKKRKK